MTDHPVHDHNVPEDREFPVLRTRLVARNNLPDGTADTGTEPVFCIKFDAVRKYVPVTPAFSTTERAKPVAQPWTGNQYGEVWIPRIGDEVLIQCLRPVR